MKKGKLLSWRNLWIIIAVLGTSCIGATLDKENEDQVLCIPSTTFQKLRLCLDTAHATLSYRPGKDTEDVLEKDKKVDKRRIFSLAKILYRNWPFIFNGQPKSTNHDAPNVRVIKIKKKPFDSIKYQGSMGGLQKRGFDSIAYHGTMGGFKKRPFDRISFGSIGGFQKRKFDPISYYGTMGTFRKRTFDPISHKSSLGGLHKRRFDSIAYLSSFGGISKRRFDSIAYSSGVGNLKKRPFDSINYASSFGGFG